MRTQSLRLNAPPNQKVRFTGTGGYEHHLEEAKKHLHTKTSYTVANTVVGKSLSYVILKEQPEHQFNTVCFIELEPFLEPVRSVLEIYEACLQERSQGLRRASQSHSEES